MKKLVAIILVLAMCLSLCACGKSKNAVAAEKGIEAIGTVSLESGAAIAEAEALYAALTEEEKEEVENYAVLESARNEYNGLLVADAEAKIDLIDLSDPNANGALEAAKAAYDALPEDVKAQVSNAAHLETAVKVSSLIITNFQPVSAEMQTVYDFDIEDWYSNVGGALLHVNFWLQMAKTGEVVSDDVGVLPYVAINRADGRVESYAEYGTDAIVCYRYWPDEAKAEVGTIETDLSVEGYLLVMQEAGIVDEYMYISEEYVRTVIAALYNAIQ